MEIEKKIEWLKPERILKLYNGQKSIFGINRLLVVGVGKNGVDCVLRCKHITEKRFGTDSTKVRYLGIGEEKQIESLSCFGTTLADNEKLSIAATYSIHLAFEAAILVMSSFKVFFAPMREGASAASSMAL